MIVNGANAVVSKQPVISAKSEKRITARSAIDMIATGRAFQNVIAGAAIDHRHPVVAACIQVAEIEGAASLRKFDQIISTKCGNAELFDDRPVLRVAPRRIDNSR